jgi:hypothetical protein
MRQSPTQIVQSFWLRFWHESDQGELQQWRGTIWHEQQRPGEKPKVVADPEEAFEIVRRALDLPSGSEGLKFPLDGRVPRNPRRHAIFEWPRRALAQYRALRRLMRSFGRLKE